MSAVPEAVPDMLAVEPPAASCHERTRSAVLNILVAEGFGIALSGYLLRRPDIGTLFRAPDVVRQLLLEALMVLAVGSYLWRRVWSSRGSLRDPVRRARRFYLAHVIAAVFASFAIPLGFIYGLLI